MILHMCFLSFVLFVMFISIETSLFGHVRKTWNVNMQFSLIKKLISNITHALPHAKHYLGKTYNCIGLLNDLIV